MWHKRVNTSVAVILMLSSFGSLVHAGTVETSALNTAADLDLSGNIVYAVNFGNNGNPRLGDFVFSQDQDYPTVTCVRTAEGVVTTWGGQYPNTGDPELDKLLGGVAWRNDGPGQCTISVAVSGMIVGVTYRLQIIFYDPLGHSRLMDIAVDGDPVVENHDFFATQGGVSGKGGSVLKYVFTAGDLALNIDLTPKPNDGSTASGISGLILTKLEAPCPDFNGDWKVDIADLIILIEHWGQNDPSLDIAPPPLGDGFIDRQDLEVLMSYWGQELPDPALIAQWRLDETEGSMARESVGGSGAVVLGNPLWQPTGGQVDGALQLDGIYNCVVTSFVLDPAQGPFSVLAWVKGGAPGQVIISQPNGADWLMADAEGKLMTELSSPNWDADPLQSQTIITDGQWHWIGLIWDGSRRMLCVDGAAVAEDAQDALPSSGNGFYIGTGKTMQLGTFWSGLIDDVRIYRRAVKP